MCTADQAFHSESIITRLFQPSKRFRRIGRGWRCGIKATWGPTSYGHVQWNDWPDGSTMRDDLQLATEFGIHEDRNGLKSED